MLLSNLLLLTTLAHATPAAAAPEDSTETQAPGAPVERIGKRKKSDGEASSKTSNGKGERGWNRANLEPEVFGGVTFGRSWYPYVVQPSEDFFDGRTGYFAEVETFSVGSSYLARIADSRFYTGFGVTANFGQKGQTSKRFNNPFCVPMDDGQEFDYGDGLVGVCDNLLGTQTTNEALLLVPVAVLFA